MRKNENHKWFCSKACLSQSHIKKRNAEVCKKCGKLFTPNYTGQLYCCHKCANSDRTWSIEKRCEFSHAQRMRMGYDDDIKRTFKCLHCGEVLKRGRKFCSLGCKCAYSTVNMLKRAEACGKFPTTTHGETDRVVVKRCLLYKYGSKCAICGAQVKDLVCDHIDGDALNSDVNNLRLVCHDCDSKLPTYKNRPHKSTRMWRRKKYNQN